MQRRRFRLAVAEDEVGERRLDAEALAVYQKQFLYHREEIESVVRVMGENGQEPVGSTGR